MDSLYLSVDHGSPDAAHIRRVVDGCTIEVVDLNLGFEIVELADTYLIARAPKAWPADKVADAVRERVDGVWVQDPLMPDTGAEPLGDETTLMWWFIPAGSAT